MVVAASGDKYNAVLRHFNIFHWMKNSNQKQILIASAKICQQIFLSSALTTVAVAKAMECNILKNPKLIYPPFDKRNATNGIA